MRSLMLSVGVIALMGCPQSTIDPVDSNGVCVHTDRIFNGDVVIPRDADCTFNDVRINGYLEMREGSYLEATDLTVEEHFLAEDTLAVIVMDSDFQQRVELLGGEYVEFQGTDVRGLLRVTDQTDELWLVGNDIGGEVRIIDNTANTELIDNRIRDALHMQGNTGGILLQGNEVDGTVSCSDNEPPPVLEANDFGGAEGQCADPV